jgi:chemotaxis protein methyltransferase CheR
MINWSKAGGTDKEHIDSLLQVIKEVKGIEFREYAQPSLERRIYRFIEINKVSGFDDLKKKIKFENGFADNFIHEITVNVSEMFRDPVFWSTLRETVLKEIKNQSIIKIWHAGCSMGEEVYSMAVLLREENLLYKSRIVATDINIDALKIAQSGVYPLKNQELHSKNYLLAGGKGNLCDNYKIKDKMVQYDQELVKKIEFKRHDLSSDLHFGSFDLIICRNVFIYFGLNLQERVLGIFNESLNENSFLCIGSKESISWLKAARFFKPVSIENKIFKKV